MRICALLMTVFLLLTATAWSQSGKGHAPVPEARAQSIITVKIDGLVCSGPLGSGVFSVQAWSFGAVNSGTSSTGGGGGAGKATVSDLNVQKKFDECSPKLFEGVLTGRHFRSLILTQQDKEDAVTTVTLKDVLISSYQLAGSEHHPEPAETLSFDFREVCVRTQNATEFCYDIAAQKPL